MDTIETQEAALRDVVLNHARAIMITVMADFGRELSAKLGQALPPAPLSMTDMSTPALIAHALARPQRPLSRAELILNTRALRTRLGPAAIGKEISRMTKQGKLSRTADGCYTLP